MEITDMSRVLVCDNSSVQEKKKESVPATEQQSTTDKQASSIQHKVPYNATSHMHIMLSWQQRKHESTGDWAHHIYRIYRVQT